jgi:hypothetical protein
VFKIFSTYFIKVKKSSFWAFRAGGEKDDGKRREGSSSFLIL